VLQKKVKWYKLQVKLKHRMSIQQRSEEFKVAEMNLCICEPEPGPILGEEDDDENLMQCSDQHKEEMLETSKETRRSHDFETNVLSACMYTGTEVDEDQAQGFVIKEEGKNHQRNSKRVEENTEGKEFQAPKEKMGDELEQGCEIS